MQNGKIFQNILRLVLCLKIYVYLSYIILLFIKPVYARRRYLLMNWFYKHNFINKGK